MISSAESVGGGLPELCGTKVIQQHVLGGEVSDRTLRKLIACGRFPKPDVRLSAKLRFWRRDTVLSWIEEQNGQ